MKIFIAIRYSLTHSPGGLASEYLVSSDNYFSRLTTIRIPGFPRPQYPTLTPCKHWRLDGYRRASEETDEADSNREDVGRGRCQGRHGLEDRA